MDYRGEFKSSPFLLEYMTVISQPTPAYSNPAITPQYYNPSRFVISAITTGTTTTITTSTAHNYVIGQLVRLLIPYAYGTTQLNERQGYVLSIPSTTQVLLDIDSRFSTAFIASPYTATITGATNASPCVLTCSSSFTGGLLTIAGVAGLTQLNRSNLRIIKINATTITLDFNTFPFSAYTSGGTATLQSPITAYPQIMAIGDINSGTINASGRTNQGTYIPGSFIDVSPV